MHDSGPRPVVPAPPQRPLWIVATVGLAAFAALTLAVARHHPPFDVDLDITHALQSAASPALEVFMRVISGPGDRPLWSTLVVVAAVAVLLVFKAWREAIFLVAVVLVGQVLKVALKELIDRPRPSSDLVDVMIRAVEEDSFPSGHTVHYTVFFGGLFYLTLILVRPPALCWALMAVFGAMVLLVGVSRIYLGAHWASDIVGGYLLGGAVLAVGIAIYQRITSPPPWAG